MKRVLLIDNYDSFIYNISQLLEEAGARVEIIKNDEIDFGALKSFDGAIISPGPGLPETNGDILKFIGGFKKPIFGICLGHQAIAQFCGAKLKRIDPSHGVFSNIRILRRDPIFKGISGEFIGAGRYHSWSVDSNGLPPNLEITSVSADGEIMSLRRTDAPMKSVQFHPESVMTENGIVIISNWLKEI